jgi:hypothetical protein
VEHTASVSDRDVSRVKAYYYAVKHAARCARTVILLPRGLRIVVIGGLKVLETHLWPSIR